MNLRAIWRATAEPGAFNAIVRILILTGQRREEVAGMAWGELAPDPATWTIPAARAKNGVAHIVPLSPQAQAILRAAPRFERAARQRARSGLPRSRGAFNGFSKAKAALDEASGIKDWRFTTCAALWRLDCKSSACGSK